MPGEPYLESGQWPARSRTLGILFFFFQAEDGIRDDLVTGVQTCALPISLVPILARNCLGFLSSLQPTISASVAPRDGRLFPQSFMAANSSRYCSFPCRGARRGGLRPLLPLPL